MSNHHFVHSILITQYSSLSTQYSVLITQYSFFIIDRYCFGRCLLSLLPILPRANSPVPNSSNVPGSGTAA